MELRLNNIPAEMLIRLKSTVRNARETGCYLKSSKNEIPWPHPISILSLIFFILIVSNSDIWSSRWGLTLLGPIILFFLIRELSKIWIWLTLGRDAIFFDSKYCMIIMKGDLTILPLAHYENSDIILSSEKTYQKARFHFNNKTILIPCSKVDVNYSNFQRLIAQYSIRAKDSIDVGKFNQTIQNNFLDKFSIHKSSIIGATFALILLWFIVPKLIDYNQYRSAKIINTATSYRSYLYEENNIIYREQARAEITDLYNKYINLYTDSASGVEGADAFKELLEYLRDRNLYSIDIIFSPLNELVNSSDNKYNIKPITPSFSPEKNAIRHNQVINAVKSSIGKIFPTDIMTVSSEKSVGELPRFEITYSYKNNPESIYYPIEQKSLQPEKRTWFYGIVIEWSFEISLKTKPNPIYSFKLLSQPAEHLSAATLNSDDVYSSMATSAFGDFQIEFSNRFFPSQKSHIPKFGGNTSSIDESAIKFTTIISKNQLAVGEKFQITYSLNTSGSGFRYSPFSEFDVYSGPNQSTGMQIVNGKISQSNSFSFILAARKEGTYSIFPATIIVNGKKIESKSTTKSIKVKGIYKK